MLNNVNNTLKIDKAFLDDYCDADRNGQIIPAIIELAHGMRLKVVAEGVETEDQYEFLKVNDCDMIQGYLISKPVSMQEVELKSKFLKIAGIEIIKEKSISQSSKDRGEDFFNENN